ncbi:MAG: amidohydrolase family protein [Gemmatimonadetes bacterium]|nr:amidohydrolase family protein [Gemmatimonadota bacterium]
MVKTVHAHLCGLRDLCGEYFAVVAHPGTSYAASLLVLLLTACNPGKGKIAYVGATLWDGTGAPPVRDAVIIVTSSGHIERAGPPDAVKVPRGAALVRAEGTWIIPGLIDAHAHAERWTLPRFLAYGVTAVRDVGGQQDSIVALREATSLGAVPGPRLYISGAMIDGTPATWRTATAAATEDAARRAVNARALIDATQAKLPVTGHLGKVDAVRAAGMGIRAIEHATGVVEAIVADPTPYFQAHDDFFRGWNLVERGWATLDPAALQRTAEALKQAGVAIVPTLALHEIWAHLEDSTYLVTLDLTGVPPSVQEAWDVPDLIARARLGFDDYVAFRRSRPVQDRFVRAYHRLGGLIAAGSDAPNQLLPPGASLHEELALLVSAGLAPRDALFAATRDAARLLGVDSIGVVRDGGVADFVILAASPLDDIKNTRSIEAVVARGVYRTSADLRALWRAR